MPSVIAPAFPLINGHRMQFSSCEINVAGVLLNAVKAVNYKQTLDPGKLRGNHAQIFATTRGTHDAEGSLELYRSEYKQLVLLLTATSSGHGYMEVPFDISVTYSEGTETHEDKLVGCRITGTEASGSEGNEPLAIKVDLHIRYIVENGCYPLSVAQMLK